MVNRVMGLDHIFHSLLGEIIIYIELLMWSSLNNEMMSSMQMYM